MHSDNRICSKCGELKESHEFKSGRSWCSACHREYDRWAQVKSRYGITRDDFEKMNNDQDGCCAICEKTNQDNYRLQIDHDHKTGEVRGLLCSRCNKALQLILDSADIARRMVGYLTKDASAALSRLDGNTAEGIATGYGWQVTSSLSD